jgi:thiamine-phosphate pyrophosphorylase
LLLYYITDRMQFPGGERERRERLLEKISEAAGCGVDYVQLREKDLPSRELEALARDVVARIRASGSNAHLLINSRTDVALAVGAEGVHLRSRDVSPDAVRKVWRSVRGAAASIVAVSCHTKAEVVAAEKSDADLAVFGPVFEKKGAPEMGTRGLDLLRAVCRKKIQVFALGGVTAENAVMCMDAGATGVAGVRLFQETNVAAAVARLRG